MDQETAQGGPKQGYRDSSHTEDASQSHPPTPAADQDGPQGPDVDQGQRQEGLGNRREVELSQLTAKY